MCGDYRVLSLYRRSFHLQIVTVLSLLFQVRYFLFLFLVWLWWPEIPILCWIELVRVGILVLFLNLAWRLSAFHRWVLHWLWVCYKWFLICWETFSLYPLLWIFIMNVCWILSHAFSASIEMIMWFLSSLLLMWCITLIDLQMLNHLEWIQLNYGVWSF